MSSIRDLDQKLWLRLFLAINNALLGRITAQIRAIEVDYRDQTIVLYIYSEKELSQEDIQEFETAAQEIAADIQELPVKVKTYTVPVPGRLFIKEEPFFIRKEMPCNCSNKPSL